MWSTFQHASALEYERGVANHLAAIFDVLSMSRSCSVLPHAVIVRYTASVKTSHMRCPVIDCHIKNVPVCRWRWMCPAGQWKPTRQRQQSTPTWQTAPRWMQTLAVIQRWGRIFQGQEMEKSCPASGLPTVPSCMPLLRTWSQLGTGLAAFQRTRHAHRFVDHINTFVAAKRIFVKFFKILFLVGRGKYIHIFWSLILIGHSKMKSQYCRCNLCFFHLGPQ